VREDVKSCRGREAFDAVREVTEGDPARAERVTIEQVVREIAESIEDAADELDAERFRWEHRPERD